MALPFDGSGLLAEERLTKPCVLTAFHIDQTAEEARSLFLFVIALLRLSVLNRLLVVVAAAHTL